MGRPGEGHRLSAHHAWLATIAAGRVTELAARLPHSAHDARAILRAFARSIGEAPASMRERVLRRPPTVFFDYARDAAAAFGNANAAAIVHGPLAAALGNANAAAIVHGPLAAALGNANAAAIVHGPLAAAHGNANAAAIVYGPLAAAFGNANAAAVVHGPLAAAIEAIKIIDDVQDEEPRCLATEIGVDAALNVAMGALAWCLELTAELPIDDDAWRAAAVAIGRGVRETAIGQMLETTVDGGFEEFWSVVDHKTPPLVATALELGSLAAGASPARAAALTRLAIPLGRLLQIGDDCHDALGPDAADWRNPALNLLMRYSLSGPNRAELAMLLRDAADPSSLRAAQVLLLRDGALGYAIHAQVATLDALAATIEALALPNPAPFAALLERHRADTDDLLRSSGVSAALASQVAGSSPRACSPSA